VTECNNSAADSDTSDDDAGDASDDDVDDTSDDDAGDASDDDVDDTSDDDVDDTSDDDAGDTSDDDVDDTSDDDAGDTSDDDVDDTSDDDAGDASDDADDARLVQLCVRRLPSCVSEDAHLTDRDGDAVRVGGSDCVSTCLLTSLRLLLNMTHDNSETDCPLVANPNPVLLSLVVVKDSHMMIVLLLPSGVLI